MESGSLKPCSPLVFINIWALPGLASLFLMAWVVPRLERPGTCDGSLNTPASSVLLRDLRVQRRSACGIWNHTDSTPWLCPLPPNWEIWLTSSTCKGPKLGFCLSHKHSLCSWHFLSSSWIKDHSLGEKPAEASVTHPKIKVKALCQVLIRQKPSVSGLERQIMEKKKNKLYNFWLSIISNVRFCMYTFAIISPSINFNSIEAEGKDVLMGWY